MSANRIPKPVRHALRRAARATGVPYAELKARWRHPPPPRWVWGPSCPWLAPPTFANDTWVLDRGADFWSPRPPR